MNINIWDIPMDSKALYLVILQTEMNIKVLALHINLNHMNILPNYGINYNNHNQIDLNILKATFQLNCSYSICYGHGFGHLLGYNYGKCNTTHHIRFIVIVMVMAMNMIMVTVMVTCH